MRKQIRKVIEALRNFFPELDIGRVVDDIESSIEEFGIKVFYSDMKDLEQDGRSISGFARVNTKNGRPEIVINGNESLARQRFTMAHELGHIILHWKWLPGKTIENDLYEVTYRKDIGYSTQEKVRERQANEFAAEFLLPLESVKNRIEMYKKLGVFDKSLVESSLVDTFKVSFAFAEVQTRKALDDEREG